MAAIDAHESLPGATENHGLPAVSFSIDYATWSAASASDIIVLTTNNGVKKLIVSAYIVNDSFWTKNSLYRSGALQN